MLLLVWWNLPVPIASYATPVVFKPLRTIEVVVSPGSGRLV